MKPYERIEVVKVLTFGGAERFEKQEIGVIHELLSLTVEKMVQVNKLAHFRNFFAMEVNVLELLLAYSTYLQREAHILLFFLEKLIVEDVWLRQIQFVLFEEKSSIKTN